MIKRFRLLIILAFILLTSIICFKLYLLNIDLHYGNLGEIFYESQDGYLVHNLTDKTIAQLEKNGIRLYVLSKNDELVELKEWKLHSGDSTQIVIYRPKVLPFRIGEMSEAEFERMVKDSKFVHITSN